MRLGNEHGMGAMETSKLRGLGHWMNACTGGKERADVEGTTKSYIQKINSSIFIMRWYHLAEVTWVLQDFHKRWS